MLSAANCAPMRGGCQRESKGGITRQTGWPPAVTLSGTTWGAAPQCGRSLGGCVPKVVGQTRDARLLLPKGRVRPVSSLALVYTDQRHAGRPRRRDCASRWGSCQLAGLRTSTAVRPRGNGERVSALYHWRFLSLIAAPPRLHGLGSATSFRPDPARDCA